MDDKGTGFFKRLFGEKRKKDKEEIYKDMMVDLRKRGNLIKSRNPIIGKAYSNRLRNLFAMMEQENEYDFLDGNDSLLSEDDLSMIANSTQFSNKKSLGYKDRTGTAGIYSGISRIGTQNVLSDEDILKKLLQIPELRQGNR